MMNQNDSKIIMELMKSLSEGYRLLVPEGKVQLNKSEVKNWNDMLALVIDLFKKEEDVIEWKRDIDYENHVRNFAILLVKILKPYRDRLVSRKNDEMFLKLLGKRHVAYGYFYVVNETSYIEDNEEWDSLDERYQESLYLGLVEFYARFYGVFHDNEEAIKFLCKFFPKKIAPRMEEYAEKIAAALYPHVSTAGTTNDLGYAYHGIELIETYIHKLPEKVVIALIGKYRLYDLAYNKVYRHQMFSIIKFAGFDDKVWRKLKFWCLDSLVVVYAVNMLYSQKLAKDENVDWNDTYDNCMVFEEEIKVSDQPPLCWKQEIIENQDNWFGEDRVLFYKEKLKIRIKLQGNEVIVSDEEKAQSVRYEYKVYDWLLENYSGKQKREQLRKMVLDEEANGPMLFSLVYLDNYRGLQQQVIDFDHRFAYRRENDTFEKNVDTGRIPHFYGESVYSLSCIVGKNATGKTSIVEFLRETFFLLLKYIEEQKAECEEGYVREEEYEK